MITIEDGPYFVLSLTILVSKWYIQWDNVVLRRNPGCNLNRWIKPHRFANDRVQIRKAVQLVHRGRVVRKTAQLGAELHLTLWIQ